jgi:hypothetical protein
MTRLAKFACSAVLSAAFFASAPAHAQFGGMDESQMQQFAPMLEMMKKQMGKRQFGQLMQTVGPMFEKMQGGGGLGGLGGGGLGGNGMGGMDIGQIMSMMGSMKGLLGGGNGRRHKARRRA